MDRHYATLFNGITTERASYLVESRAPLSAEAISKLENLLEARHHSGEELPGPVIGPRREIVSPWSTNASEIAANVGIAGITRIECFHPANGHDPDPMVQESYPELELRSLVVDRSPEPVRAIENIAAYNKEAGLALSDEEIQYLERTAAELGRPFTDAELFGFAQVNSEHCRHKIFNGTFRLAGETKHQSLFALIKETTARSGANVVSAYRDNVAFTRGPCALRFATVHPEQPGFYRLSEIDTVLSLKAETHNFPTTVEPFNGASTGTGGEIRDRMAGGRGSIPLAGTAVYMTAYPRLKITTPVAGLHWVKPRRWQYQSPAEILTKASNGASDFGNKFGQPLINGSVLTFEMPTSRALYAYDKCIMLAGGVGYADRRCAEKQTPARGDKIILLGGDNYRIGMAGGSVSSVKGGEYSRELELSAVQRANAEMQKRVFNVLRALAELDDNPIKLVHDHGAGGHMNCFTELVEEMGGIIYLDRLPIGDKTLSVREIISNESQERMGLVVAADAVPLIEKIAERERAPLYVVGEVTGSKGIVFQAADGTRPVDLPLSVLLGSSPRTCIEDDSLPLVADPLLFAPADGKALLSALKQVLSLESVACKDWLTNKVDRSVTGRVAQQQCVGPLQLPLANAGVTALDFTSRRGIATAIGHAPGAGLLDEAAGSVLSLAEALTNLIWAPLKNGLSTVTLSANWMWPCKRPGENARLYHAVEALSHAAIALGIPVPTGKDSLSMTTVYQDGSEVRSPGTVIISAMGEVDDITLSVTPDLKSQAESAVLYVNLSGLNGNPLGGSALAQALGRLGEQAPTVVDLQRFKGGLLCLQELIHAGDLLAGHDVSSGGVLPALCEMAFAGNCGIAIELSALPKEARAEYLFCEKPAVLLQVPASQAERIAALFQQRGLESFIIARPLQEDQIVLDDETLGFRASLPELRRIWFEPSALMDERQTRAGKARERSETFDRNPLLYRFPAGFSGRAADYGVDLERRKETGIRAAIVREKGTNGDREMAFSLFAAGFDVKDVTMSDLMSGRETLSDLNMIVFPGGFSNSDVLGAGRGWGAAFRYNRRALEVLDRFMARPDTLSLGICNGCQLMAALSLLHRGSPDSFRMQRNDSGKFESAFLNVQVFESSSIMLRGLAGSRLGLWVAHGEGKFILPGGEAAYQIPVRYCASSYPANPNGSDFDAAAVVSDDGRHLAMMPHLERAVLPFQWGCYAGPGCDRRHEITPWMLAFVNARLWIAGQSR